MCDKSTINRQQSEGMGEYIVIAAQMYDAFRPGFSYHTS